MIVSTIGFERIAHRDFEIRQAMVDGLAGEFIPYRLPEFERSVVRSIVESLQYLGVHVPSKKCDEPDESS